KGLVKNGANSTILYGYGGFNINMTPSFKPTRTPYLDRGGVFAVAVLRGGGEYGEDWHKAGTKTQKQNVFDDFIAAAEFLIAEKFASPETLAINGGSNGGLLVGAALTQRPDLFAAAVPQVGVLDMLRYHKFTIGWAWANDYGTSEESEEMFRYLLKYSPLHNVRKDAKYPATMVMTSDHDDRVVPAHSMKFAATLQANADATDAPLLIRIESKAGHGAGKPTSKIVDEAVDMYAFILFNTQKDKGVEK
ncbi:MAG: S9 family peptidase, partial [Thermoguttaceae bacterium]|nr:S9 family peptidase [Thermoguttaceae bacterium]